MLLRFGFDPGEASLGLAAVALDPDGSVRVLAAASRICLPSPPGEALRIARNRARRRHLANRKARRRAFIGHLRETNLLPPERDEALFALDPKTLCKRAMTEPVTRHQFGRLLVWLHSRRFRSRALENGQSTADQVDRLLEAQAGSGIQKCEAEAIRRQFINDSQGRRKAATASGEYALIPVRRLLADAMADLERRFGLPDEVMVEGAIAAEAGMPGKKQLRDALARQQAQAAGGAPFCPYTGTVLTEALLTSRHVEIDHIVPRSAGGGDGLQNLVLCLASANHEKGARTPWQAFGQTPQWPAIMARLERLPTAIRPAFAPDALPATDDARRRRRMERICALVAAEVRRRWPDASVKEVPPYLVAARRKLLLSRTGNPLFSKDRQDNRHHGVDALSAALAGLATPKTASKLDVTVTHEVKRSLSGRCMDDTAYGPVHAQDQQERQLLPGLCVHRKPVTALSRTEIAAIRDPHLREQLDRRLPVNAKGVALENALQAFSKESGVRRVRLVHRLASARPARNGTCLLLPNGNHHCDIVSLPDRSWALFGVTLADAARPGFRPEWERERIGAKLVMRLHRGDALELDDYDGNRVVRIVRRLPATGRYLWLAAPEEGGALAARHGDPTDPFRWDLASAENLRERHARAIQVAATGTWTFRRSNVTV